MLLSSIIFVVALIRFVAYPLTMVWDADAVARTWIAIDWLKNPFVIPSDVWGPGYTYFLASMIAITGDPFEAPIFINIILSLATAVILYFITQKLFSDERASLFVAAAYALYPVAIRSSYLNMPETPSVFFLALAFYFLVRAKANDGTLLDCVLAGLFLTVTASMRFEVWLYIPLLGLILYKKYRFIIVFWIFAMIFPAYWMISSYIDQGNPFFSMAGTSEWELVIEEANESLEFKHIIQRVFFFPTVIACGVTPIISLLIFSGILLSVYERKLQSIWIIAPVILLLLMIYNAINGSLEIKARYTLPVTIFLYPFIALAVQRMLNYQWGANVAIAMLISIIPLSYLGNFGTPDFVYALYEGSFNAVPIVDATEIDTLKTISAAVNGELTSDNALISDYYQWTETYYVLYETRLEPDRVFVAPGGKNEPIDEVRAARVLAGSGEGLLLLNPGSRFAEFIGFSAGSESVEFLGYTLQLDELVTKFVLEGTELELYRYTIS